MTLQKFNFIIIALLVCALPSVSQNVDGQLPINTASMQQISVCKNLPISFSEETRLQGVKVTLEDLYYIYDEQDVYSRICPKVEVQLPFATSATGDHTVCFSGCIELDSNAPKRIYLKSQHEFTLIKDKVKMVILPTIAEGNASDKGGCSTADSSFVEFDCNGVQDVMLTGRFVFSESFLKPASGKGGPVVANFSFRYSSGLITKVCFSDSFRVGGCGDFVFEVTDALADFSEEANGAGFSLPHGYWDGPLPEQAWMGFFLREVSARLPKELNINKNKASKPKIALKNVLIDDYGFTMKKTNKIDIPCFDKKTNLNHSNAISNAVITRGDFNTLEVRWNKQIYRITKYYIYRQVNGSEPVLIMTLSGNERAFMDKNTIKGYRYRYFIMPICDAPAKTISTEEIRL